MDTTNAYQRKIEFKNFFNKFLKDKERPSQEDLDLYTQQIKELSHYTCEAKRIYVLLDHSKFYPAYVSKSFETESGYSFDYINKQGPLFLFKSLHYKQLSVIYKVNVWGPRIVDSIGKGLDQRKLNISICGLKFKDTWGKWRTYMLTQKILTVGKDNKALLSFIGAEEITYFHDSDVCWYRVSTDTDHGRLSKVFFLNAAKKEANELFTNRELEILKLVANRYTVKDIVEHLSLSKNTVERHRKNMISKVGVTNMTGVIRIAQILNLV